MTQQPLFDFMCSIKKEGRKITGIQVLDPDKGATTTAFQVMLDVGRPRILDASYATQLDRAADREAAFEFAKAHGLFQNSCQ